MKKLDIGSFELNAIIDIPSIHDLLEDLHHITEMALAILDLNGKILIAVGWQDVCTRFHRINPQTALNCMESDLYLSKHVQQGDTVSYKCKNRLWNILTPLFIGGKHVGNVCAGQFFCDDEILDLDVFRKQAVEHGFELESYLDAVRRVPRISRKKAGDITNFVVKFAVMASELSYSKLRLESALSEQKRTTEALQTSYNLLYTGMRDALVSADMQGHIKDCNEYYLNMVGYTPEEIKTLTYRDLTPEKWHAMEAAIVERQVLTRGYSDIYEKEYRRKDGAVFPVELRTILLTDADGSPRGMWAFVRDISERKQAEMTLKENEDVLRSLLEATPTGVGLLVERKFSKVNRALCRITGYSEEELLGQSTRILYPDNEEFERIGRELYGQMKREGLGVAEARLKTKDGAIVFVILCLSLFDPNDMNKGVTATVMDITARKEAENELKRIKFAIDSATDAIGMATAEGHHFYQNEAFDRMFGFTVEEVARRHPIAAYKREEVGREVFEAIISGKSWQGEVEMIAKDGRGLPIFLRADAIKDAKGNVVGVIGVHTDISERKKAEEQLVRSEEQYRTLVDNMQDVIYRTDNEGNLVYISPSAPEVLGCSSTEKMIGLNVARDFYYHPEERQKFLEALKQQGKMRNYEATLKRKDNGNPVFVSENSQYYHDKDGRILGVDGMFRDISERKRLEEQFIQAQKMESVGRLAGGVAHDFNNLLTVISGNTELALMEKEHSAGVAAQLEEVKKAAARAAELTKQLLVFSRKEIIEQKVIDLSALIKDMKKMLGRLIGEDITLKTLAWPGTYLVKVDPGQMHQILMNLAVNARDAMPNGGVFALETSLVVLDEAYCRLHSYVTPGENVLLTVSDTGDGMTEEVKKHLFEPFYTTKPLGKGTGLGLATVYGAVRQNSGTIEVYSEPEKGTCFKIYFPKASGVGETLSTVADEMPMTGGAETILVVEDDPSVQGFSRQMLITLGYRVLTASNGEEALRVAQGYAGVIHLLMTDVVLPGMNGRQVADMLTERYPGLKVLYCSGYTEDIIVRHGVLESQIHFISKPFTMPAVARKIRSILDMLD